MSQVIEMEHTTPEGGVSSYIRKKKESFKKFKEKVKEYVERPKTTHKSSEIGEFTDTQPYKKKTLAERYHQIRNVTRPYEYKLAYGIANIKPNYDPGPGIVENIGSFRGPPGGSTFDISGGIFGPQRTKKQKGSSSYNDPFGFSLFGPAPRPQTGQKKHKKKHHKKSKHRKVRYEWIRVRR